MKEVVGGVGVGEGVWVGSPSIDGRQEIIGGQAGVGRVVEGPQRRTNLTSHEKESTMISE